MKTNYRFIERTDEDLVNVPGFLGGDFGKEVLEEVNKKYTKLPVVAEIGKFSDGLVKGSNDYFAIAVNEVLESNGFPVRIATQADLEKILRDQTLDLSGNYEDTGLVLRSEGSPNEYLAKHLMKQVKARKPNQEFPVMIPLRSLTLGEDQDAEYGLVFNLRENGEVVYAPVLNKDGRFNPSDVDETTGLPRSTRDSGEIGLYTRSSGLSGLYLDDELDLISNDCGLGDSNSDGRVVVVNARGFSNKNLEENKNETK